MIQIIFLIFFYYIYLLQIFREFFKVNPDNKIVESFKEKENNYHQIFVLLLLPKIAIPASFQLVLLELTRTMLVYYPEQLDI